MAATVSARRYRRLFAAHGAHVEVAEIDPDRAARIRREVTDAGGAIRSHVVDVTVDDDVAGLADAVLTEHGRIDVLVNNVGDYRPLVAFDESTPATWQRMYDINLRHVFAVTRAFVPAMIEAHRGSIVNVHSVEGMRGFPRDPVYGAMKAAVAHFTTCLAVDVGRHGIRVNGIGTDLTQTPQVDYLTGYEDVEELWQSWAPVGPRRLARGPGAGGAVPGIRPVRVRHRAQHPGRRRNESRWRLAVFAAGRPVRQSIQAPVTCPVPFVCLPSPSGGNVQFTRNRRGCFRAVGNLDVND